MAIKKRIEKDSTGIFGEYLKISHAAIDYTHKLLTVRLELWEDEAAAGAEGPGSPLDIIELSFDREFDGFPFTRSTGNERDLIEQLIIAPRPKPRLVSEEIPSEPAVRDENTGEIISEEIPAVPAVYEDYESNIFAGAEIVEDAEDVL